MATKNECCMRVVENVGPLKWQIRAIKSISSRKMARLQVAFLVECLRIKPKNSVYGSKRPETKLLGFYKYLDGCSGSF